MEESNNPKIPIIAVVGPTASGKTALGVYLAKILNGEVISADSMQIYKGMDIASAKPKPEEMDGILHHLLDFQNPSDSFDVATYTKLAHQAVLTIREKGKQPIVVGGTGLYIDSFLQNIQFDPIEIDQEYQKALEFRGANGEGSSLLKELSEVDPILAQTLHSSDIKRIIRGLLVYQSTGKTLTTLKEESRRKESPYQVCWIGLNSKDRQFLYNRINQRVDQMVNQGLIEEANGSFLKEQGKTAAAAIGHKELFSYFKGECSLEEAIESVKRETRRYAKRQLTWFRRNNQIHWLLIDENSFEQICVDAKKLVERAFS